MIEYWNGIEKLIITVTAATFPPYVHGQPIELNKKPYYIEDIGWEVQTALGGGQKVTMVVRLDPV